MITSNVLLASETITSHHFSRESGLSFRHTHAPSACFRHTHETSSCFRHTHEPASSPHLPPSDFRRSELSVWANPTPSPPTPSTPHNRHTPRTASSFPAASRLASCAFSQLPAVSHGANQRLQMYGPSECWRGSCFHSTHRLHRLCLPPAAQHPQRQPCAPALTGMRGMTRRLESSSSAAVARSAPADALTNCGA